MTSYRPYHCSLSESLVGSGVLGADLDEVLRVRGTTQLGVAEAEGQALTPISEELGLC